MEFNWCEYNRISTQMANFSSKSDFQSRLKQIRDDIETKFNFVAHLVEERKNALLQILDDIMYEFEKKKNDTLEAIDLLESNKKQFSESLQNNLLSPLMSKQVDELEEKIVALKLECEEPNINLKWEENNVNELINSLGIITSEEGDLDFTNNTSTPDYECKKVPVACAVSRGQQIGEICDPRGISIDKKSGNIYVSDYGANRVSVFSPKYKFLFLFGTEDGTGKMSAPHGINIFRDKVYVTELTSHSLQVYTLKGKWVGKVGTHGSNPGEFDGPGDSFFDETNEDIYVCDSRNNRVQIFDAELQFKSIFTQNLNDPLRGRVHANSVIILENSDPTLHFFSKSGESLKSIVPRVYKSRFFDFEIDSDSKIILADVERHCVIVADYHGALIHQFGARGEKPEQFIQPWGLTLTGDGHILTTSCNAYGCLKVF